MRLVLSRATTATVRTTAADALHIETAQLPSSRWRPPVRVTHTTLPMHPSWAAIARGHGGVGVWDFHALSVDPQA